MDLLLFLEIFAVITGLAFITLMVYENIWCWPMGILSSVANIYVFYCTKLYSESILYFFYILVGIYGWIHWKKEKGQSLPVILKGFSFHTAIISIGAILTVLLGMLFSKYTDAERTFADSGSTIFSFIASYMEAHKILSSWLFWILINFFSIWLYLDRGLKLLAGQMVIYFLISVAGYLQWKKSFEKTQAELNQVST